MGPLEAPLPFQLATKLLLEVDPSFVQRGGKGCAELRVSLCGDAAVDADARAGLEHGDSDASPTAVQVVEAIRRTEMICHLFPLFDDVFTRSAAVFLGMSLHEELDPNDHLRRSKMDGYTIQSKEGLKMN